MSTPDKWVMALTRIGESATQRPWMMAVFLGDPREDGINVGDTYRFNDTPDEAWRVADVFRDAE